MVGSSGRLVYRNQTINISSDSSANETDEQIRTHLSNIRTNERHVETFIAV